ncbi:unnamed protein product [Echinostoma caproni]|uniref:Ig-like domain-containing protein n=1 Tax=Echinostoma caproni TaxID=27848 RepID=A0A183B5E3_9TREM|nr:unnamed protein product [Echinostoma caproni]
MIIFRKYFYPAELVGPAEENITEATNGVAQLDCTAEANPAVAVRSFTWYRFVPPKGWPEDSHEAALQLSPPIPCNETGSSASVSDKVFVSCQQDSQFRMSSRLSLYRLTEDDVGTYVCEVNNGLGEPVQKRVSFLHPYFTKRFSDLKTKQFLSGARFDGTDIHSSFENPLLSG